MKPTPTLMFTDVYSQMTPHLERQLSTMRAHVNQYRENYPLDRFEDF